MKVSASIVLAAALGVSAHPHGAVHQHAHRDTNLEVRDQFVKNVRPTSTVFQTVTVPAVNKAAIAAATSTSAAAPAATSKTSNSGGSKGTIGSSGKYKNDFCPGNSKRATLEDINFGGNTGIKSGKYGCVMKWVDASEAKDYQYVSVLENAASEKQTCACFLKKSATNEMNGFWSGKQILDFTLDAGESKYLAVQDGAIGGCSCGIGSLPTTSFGQIAGTWFEWEFGSEKNIGFSGADASSLVPEKYNLPFQGMTITQEGAEMVDGHEKKSIIYPSGDACNAFFKGSEAHDGWGFNIGNSGKGSDAVRLRVQWGTGGSLSDCPDVAEGEGDHKKYWRQSRRG